MKCNLSHTHFKEIAQTKKIILVHACIHAFISVGRYFFLIFIVCCVEDSLIKSCSIWTDFVYVYPIHYPGSAAAEEAFNLVVVVNRTPTEIESPRPVTFLVCFCPRLSLNIFPKKISWDRNAHVFMAHVI